MAEQAILPLTEQAVEGGESELFQPYQELIAEEQAIAPTITVDDTIRVKVLDRCGMTCNFCHNEGTPVMSGVGFQALRVSIYAPTNGVGFEQSDIKAEDAESFGRTLAGLRDQGLARELHWTGGEPTLSKELPALTSIARDAGYSVKMTSNGQSGRHRLPELAAAGLTDINFSIFGTTPAELAATQGPAFRNNLKLAELRMSKMREAMETALELGINVKANVVVSGYEDIERGMRLLAQAPEAVKVRFQADTSRRTESLAAIYELMTRLDAHPVAREIVAGCSIDNYDYQLPNGRVVTYKQTHHSRLPEACDGCTIDAAGNYHEGYYGLRLYKDVEDTYWISPCIQRMDTAQTVDEFLQPDGLGAAVKSYREQDYAQLLLQYQ